MSRCDVFDHFAPSALSGDDSEHEYIARALEALQWERQKHTQTCNDELERMLRNAPDILMPDFFEERTQLFEIAQSWHMHFVLSNFGFACSKILPNVLGKSWSFKDWIEHDDLLLGLYPPEHWVHKRIEEVLCMLIDSEEQRVLSYISMSDLVYKVRQELGVSVGNLVVE